MRVLQAGAKPVTALSVMLEWQLDWALKDTYDAVMDIVKNHCGAYGVGVEYAYTMVHGAPATKLPDYVPAAAPNAHTSQRQREQDRVGDRLSVRGLNEMVSGRSFGTRSCSASGD